MSNPLKNKRYSYEEDVYLGNDDGDDYHSPLGYAAWLVQERNELYGHKE